MRNLTYTILAIVGCVAVFAACSHTMEEDFQDPKDGRFTTIQAYFGEAPIVKTTYDISASGAAFSWEDGDNIDVSVYNSAKDIRSYIVFTRMASEDPTTVQDNQDKVFKDGQNGNRTFASLGTGYVLDQYAFYPSRLDPDAQAGEYAPDWAVIGGKLVMDLPSDITPPSGNPLAVVPMVGKKDGSGKYAFTQLTSVLAFHITGLPDDADFISLTHPDVALAGAFEVTETERGAVVEYDKVVTKAENGLTMRFSSLGNEATFYFSLPVGIIPAGMVLTVGRSDDADSWMTKTTVVPIRMVRGTIAKVNVDIPYVPVDLQWEAYGTATFRDDFLWSNNTGYTTTPTWVPVTVERSGLRPEKFRINNPYTVACAQFGYTPYTEGVTSDPYFVFSVADDGKVTYTPFKTGVEEKASAGYPMLITNSGSYTHVVNRFKNGDVYELEFGGVYTKYEDPSFKYTRTDKGYMHLVMDLPAENWTKVADGTFIDEKLWSLHSWGTTTVPVELYQSSLFDNRFRVPNPYLIAKDQFSYSTYTEGIVGDDYLVFSIIDDDAVKFTTFLAGIEDKASAGKAMKVWYPTDFGPTYTTALAGNVVTSYWDSGLPENIELYPIYSGATDVSHKYTDLKTSRVRLSFPDVGPQLTWTQVAEGTFIDEKIWSLQGWGSTRVPIELYQSSFNANQFRVPNPYLIAKEQFGYSTYTDGIVGDDYLVFSIGENDAVKFTTFLAGIEDKSSAGRAMKVWYPSDFGTYSTALAGNLVRSYRAGLPEEVELYPIYTDVSDDSYKYTNQEDNRVRLTFPEPWKSVKTLRFKDDFIFTNRHGKPANSNVEVSLEQSGTNPRQFRIANPYPALCDALGVNKYTTDVSEYLYMTVAANNTVTYEEFRPGVGDSSKELMVCEPSDWNTKSGGSATTGKSKVETYGLDGLPEVIRLFAIYHEVDNYKPSGTSGNYLYTRADTSQGEVIVLAPTLPLDEGWTSLGNCRFKDKQVWECASLTDYVTAEIQQNNANPCKFRIAKPYPGEESGDWFVFDVTDPDQVVCDKYYLDYEVTASGKETFKPYIWTTYYSTDYSKVLSTQENGLPAVVELGVCYRKEPWVSYDYEIGRNHEMLAIEIIFPGCHSYNTLTVTAYQTPIIREFDLRVAKLSVPSNGTLNRLVVKITGGDYSKMTGLRLYKNNPGSWMQSSYVAPDANGVVTMTDFTAAINGDMDLNFRINDDSMIGSSIRFDVQEIVVDGLSLEIVQDKDFPRFPGVRVNHGGDKVTVRGYSGDAEETVASFRIPALVTTKAGTLIAAYDVRYDSSVDLQGDIDVGVKRSTDGGKTWSDLVLAMDMGTYGYNVTDADSWKSAQVNNGIGDPCLLVDENTGTIFCFAIWAHGHEGSRVLGYAGTGYEIDDTPQFMMVKSTDDGLTWSEPINLTKQLKRYNWKCTFQGPGRGITMKDGTLVIPMQHQENGVLNSGIAYSTDHGETWHSHNLACNTTSEATVAELTPGVLLLSMRDETGSHYRREYITTDLGRSWTPFAHNGQMWDSTTEASLIHVLAADNVLNKDLMLFSSPQGRTGWRNHMTIQYSLDQGVTWHENTLLIDEGASLGYSCLTMIDNATVGILYESSRGNILFQAIPLTDIIQ